MFFSSASQWDFELSRFDLLVDDNGRNTCVGGYSGSEIGVFAVICSFTPYKISFRIAEHSGKILRECGGRVFDKWLAREEN